MTMKNILQITKAAGRAALLALPVLFSACEPNQLIPFEEPASAYFGNPTISGTPVLETSYTFAKYPNRQTDTLLIPVSIYGEPAGQDREIGITLADSSIVNATEGVEFKLLPPYKMPANQVKTNLKVVLNRTPAMDSIVYTFLLKIKATNDLKEGVAAQTMYRVNLAFLQKPVDWDVYAGTQGWAGYSANFGTWTRTKYKVILDALYSPTGDTSITNFPGQRFQPPAIFPQYLIIVRNYIRTHYPGNYSTPLGVGPTLRDPDANNAIIQVGPANY